MFFIKKSFHLNKNLCKLYIHLYSLNKHLYKFHLYVYTNTRPKRRYSYENIGLYYFNLSRNRSLKLGINRFLWHRFNSCIIRKYVILVPNCLCHCRYLRYLCIQLFWTYSKHTIKDKTSEKFPNKPKIEDNCPLFYIMQNNIYYYLTTSRQSKSPRSNALINNSAVATLVAKGILCTSHKRTTLLTSGS